MATCGSILCCQGEFEIMACGHLPTTLLYMIPSGLRPVTKVAVQATFFQKQCLCFGFGADGFGAIV